MKSNIIALLHFIKTHTGHRIATAIILLIVLQSIFASFTRFLLQPEIYANILSATSYTIIVLGVLIFHAHEYESFADSFSLLAIVLGCVVRPVTGAKYESLINLYLGALGLCLVMYMISNRDRFKMPSYKSLIIGILWAVSTTVVLAIIAAFVSPSKFDTLPSNVLIILLNSLLVQFSYVTVIEESLFRGLLVGFLVMRGYKENAALGIQAVFFWAIHYAQIGNILLFFIFIPILTISTTLIVRKYKMVYMAILVHTFVNVFTLATTTVLQIYLF